MEQDASAEGHLKEDAQAASQALALQQKISALVREEHDLEVQQRQVRSQLASYEEQLREARAHGRENLARLALERSQSLHHQLLRLQAQVDELRARKEQLIQQQDSQALLLAVRAHEAELAA